MCTAVKVHDIWNMFMTGQDFSLFFCLLLGLLSQKSLQISNLGLPKPEQRVNLALQRRKYDNQRTEFQTKEREHIFFNHHNKSIRFLLSPFCWPIHWTQHLCPKSPFLSLKWGCNTFILIPTTAYLPLPNRQMTTDMKIWS